MEQFHRKEKISVFLNEYYFGYGLGMTLLRLIGGPLCILIGINLYLFDFDNLSVAFGGISTIYGVYYVLRPFLWILARLDNFKTEKVEINVDDNYLSIRDEKNESKIALETFKRIYSRKSYFSFVISGSQRLKIPKRLIKDQDRVKIEKAG